MRLFAAVRPPDDILQHVERALAGLSPLAEAAGIRWSARESLHLTLAFFGEVPEGAIDELGEGLRRSGDHVAPFALQMRGAGVFAQRMLWIGAGGEVEVMIGLAAEVRAEGERVSRFRDERPRMRPHLTIGRVGATRDARDRRAARIPVEVEHFVRALAVYEGPMWTVEEFTLESSVPGAGRGGGPRYEIVRRMGLGAVAG